MKFADGNKGVIIQFLIDRNEIVEVGEIAGGVDVVDYSVRSGLQEPKGTLRRHDFKIRLTDILPSLFKQTVASHETLLMH